MIALALVHHPVRDGKGATIASALTNIDVHDIARTGRTYGAARLFVVTPIDAQRELVDRIRGHWVDGAGKKRIPARARAIERVRPVADLEEAIAAFAEIAGQRPRVWATAANARGRTVFSFAEAREALGSADDRVPTLLVFGTAHGLADEALDICDGLLAPIDGLDDEFNHLSVRSAVAIILDRLLGPSR